MRTLLILAAAVTLSGCVGEYGYRYDYDPYLGPRGYYVGPLEPPHAPPPPAAAYAGPYDGGWRGPYYSGPYAPPP